MDHPGFIVDDWWIINVTHIHTCAEWLENPPLLASLVAAHCICFRHLLVTWVMSNRLNSWHLFLGNWCLQILLDSSLFPLITLRFMLREKDEKDPRCPPSQGFCWPAKGLIAVWFSSLLPPSPLAGHLWLNTNAEKTAMWQILPRKCLQRTQSRWLGSKNIF